MWRFTDTPKADSSSHCYKYANAFVLVGVIQICVTNLGHQGAVGYLNWLYKPTLSAGFIVQAT
jgi:hypothetical protein